MGINFDYYRTVSGAKDFPSEHEATKYWAADNLKHELINSSGYVPDAKRNGKTQPFVITASESYYKARIEALPGDELHSGDLIEALGEKWVVIDTKMTSQLQTIGLLWMCNFEFRWQNWSSVILTCPAVLDDGTYSSTKDGNNTVMTADKQFKVYMPCTEDTEKIYIDKRFAVTTMWNPSGEEILDVYQVTGRDRIGGSYIQGSHLLILNVRSADYIKGVDSMEEWVCDYIAPEPEKPDFDGKISGYPTIHIGTARVYAADFEVARWEIPEMLGVAAEVIDGKLKLRVFTDEDLLGETITISAYDKDDNVSKFDVEVIY